MILSSALVFSTQPPVSVFSTGTWKINSSGFSRELDYLLFHSRMRSRYFQVRFSRRICLPKSTSTPFNRLFRQPAGVSLLRLHFPFPSSTGILTGSSIGFAIRLLLRPRLTLIRLTLIRKPGSFGVRVSHPHYRYLYLHLLFQLLQNRSPNSFCAYWNAPLPLCLYNRTHSFGKILMPEYYPCPVTRLVSCYALFK